MIFIPSLRMWEYLDKFGKTVSVVPWIVYLNNSLLASETIFFQTICEKMTDCIHLLKNNTWNVIIHWAPLPSGLPRLIWLYPCLKLFQHACIFHIWNVCLAWNGKWHACWSLCKRFKIYIFFANKYFYLSRHVWTMT